MLKFLQTFILKVCQVSADEEEFYLFMQFLSWVCLNFYVFFSVLLIRVNKNRFFIIGSFKQNIKTVKQQQLDEMKSQNKNVIPLDQQLWESKLR